MNVKFHAHASFRLDGNGLSVVTDPYTPSIAGFGPIGEVTGSQADRPPLRR